MRSIVFLLFNLLAFSSALAQKVFQHVTSAANISGHITTIDDPSTNNKPNAIIIATQKYGVYNPNEVGVWYSQGKWKIFNQNLKPIPVKTAFNILVVNPDEDKYAFVHQTSGANTMRHITTLSNPLTDGAEDAVVLVTQRYGQYNTSPVGVWYHGGRWKIYNESLQAMPLNTQFNVLVLKPGNMPKALKGICFKHEVTSKTRIKFPGKHVSYINNEHLNNKPSLLLFTTQRYMSNYNPNSTGVWYDSPNWTVFNQDRKPITEQVTFHVLAVEPTVNPVVLTPIQRIETRIISPPNDEKHNWRVAARVNNSKIFVLPYKEDKDKQTPPADAANTEMQGPNVTLGKDLYTLLGDASFEPFLNKLNLFREIYEDKNPKSGYFYYLPRNYNLRWDRDAGTYSFYIYYLSADSNGRGDVIITAELTPNINQEDILLTEVLLGKKLNREIKLRPLPLKDTPKVSFGSSLTNFDVNDESVQTNIPSDFLEPIIVSWKMESRVDDFVGAMMNNIGLNGNIEFKPHHEEDKVITVPVRLKINDVQTYGKMEYKEASAFLNGFLNKIDYPLQMKELVVLRKKNGNDYSTQKITLNNYDVEPQQVFSSFTQGEKDALLNGDAISKIWVEYNIKPSAACNEIVESKIMGGTSGSRVKKIELQVLSPLQFSGANSIKLLIQSKQGDPDGKSEVLLPIVTISKDNQTVSGGELFIPEGSMPDYQYQMVLIQPDGTTIASEWIPSKDLFIVIGENTIRTNFKTEETVEDTTASSADNTQPIQMDGDQN